MRFLRIILLVHLLLMFSHCAECQIYISTGISINTASVNVVNLNTHVLEIYRSAKLAPDWINVLFSVRINSQFSIKSGFYTHPEYFRYTAYHNWYEGNPKITSHTEETYSRNFDFPLLISFTDKDKRFNIAAGPYIGIALFSLSDGKLKETDLGIDISAGIGSKKWQFTFYSLVGCRNLVVSALGNEPTELKEKVRATTYGLNITRILYSKKSGSK